MAEMNATGGWNRGEVYAGGRHVATYASSTTYFDLGDWVGTERVRTTAAGVKIRDGDESGVWRWAGGDGELRGSQSAAFYGEAEGYGERAG